MFQGMLQPRYAVPLEWQDRTLTATHRRAVDALSQLRRCLDEADVANACFLAADLLAGGHSQRLLGALVNAMADARYFAPALQLGVADDIATLATDSAALAAPLHANDPSIRHAVFAVVVRLCLISKGASLSVFPVCPRATLAHKLSYAPLAQLRVAVLPLLQRAPQADLQGKVAHALSLLRTQDGEPGRWRLVSLIARSAPQIALLPLADGPHARIMRVLQTVLAASPRACFTVAAFAGPGPFAPHAWSAPEQKNLLYALMKTHLVFEGLSDGRAAAAASAGSSSAGSSSKGHDGGNDIQAFVGDVQVDPAIGRGVDALFRRRAKFDRLFGYVPRTV